MMSWKVSLVGLAMLGGAALSATSASAMPVAPLGSAVAPATESVRLVCDVYGRCFRTRPRFYGGYGYYGGGPRFYGGGPRYYGGGPRFRGGYGYGRRGGIW